jgi:regulator of replication initiation timing
MSSLSEVVDSLEYKIAALLKQYKDVKQTRVELETELTALQQENLKLKEVLENREQKIKTLKTTNALLGSNDYKRETKLKINSLVREIDACIASLAE